MPLGLAPAPEAEPTPSGLRRRTPRATLAAAGQTTGDTTGSRAEEPPPFRDAAQVRDLLSQFQAGVLRAQVGLEQTSGPVDGDGGGARP
jgi:hypothetical protein